MKIYTRTGDYGKTSTITGEKVSKASKLIEVQGAIDEVNSTVGHLRSLLIKHINNSRDSLAVLSLNEFLKQIQYTLFCVGADITNELGKTYVTEQHITELEESIDQMTELTGKLNSFIYLSGHETATYAHVLRSTTRRAERRFVSFLEETMTDKMNVPLDYKYINRLADYFFQVARYLNYLFESEEEIIHL